MQITKLRLNGFKSFIDPTDLLIRPGLTGVVGPNGCGKSNLLEALRWVMGETRPSAMRGEGMEDVIFAGSRSRGARHHAEVALHLDNSARLAPAGFNLSDKLEIVRRISRDGGSVYRVNGGEVRARDVQLLFADASTGAHSPALVRQGQIAELISARPRARRRILEEAAGISGLYQRRHEAELRLNGAETNLARVSDVLDQMSAQLAALGRQARQAARYRALGADLRRAEGGLLFLRWRAADTAKAGARAGLNAASLERAQAEAAAAAVLRARIKADAALPVARDEAAIANAVLQRLEIAHAALSDQQARAAEAIRSLDARLSQLAAELARETGLNADAETSIDHLTAEARALEHDMAGQVGRLEEAQAEAASSAAHLAALEARVSAATEEAARQAAQLHSAERLLAETRRSLGRVQAATDAAAEAARDADAAASDALAGQARAAAALRAAEDRATAAEAALQAAEGARAVAQAADAVSRTVRTEAEATASTLRAQAAALAQVVARDRGTDGAGLLDQITVRDGHERALGAAMGEHLRLPTSQDGSCTGWAALPALVGAPPLPEGCTPLTAHVSAPAVLDRRLTQTGIVAPHAGAALQRALCPGQQLVSMDGDLWRWDGLHVAAADASGATALQLQRRNRLDALTGELAAAEIRAQAACKAHRGAEAALAHASEAEQTARAGRRTADVDANASRSALSRAEAAQELARSRLEAARGARLRHAVEAADLGRALDDAQRALAALPDGAAARAALEALRAQVASARSALLAGRSAADELRLAAAQRARRSQQVAAEIAGWRQRMATAGSRIAELDGQRGAVLRELAAANRVPEGLALRRDELARDIADARTRQARAHATLGAAETAATAAAAAERAAERAAGEARAAQARAETLDQGAQAAAEAAAAQIAASCGQPPQALPGSLGLEPENLPPLQALEAEAARLRRLREALGAVNLRAEADAAAVQGEFDTLAEERTDLEAAIARLRAAINALNREGRDRLLQAFARVNANFATLFGHLFGGGEARLVLVESDDPLEAGLEIMCQPPGKKLSTLSLLSGGEQTLTALALIFAVFLANPAPICVLDEVDAPLDDANVARFCDLLDEMTRRTETRFLIITHNAITMARMDRLFGVTMVEAGVSQLVSVDLHEAGSLVA